MSDDKPRRGLGRGLSSLFGDEDAFETVNTAAPPAGSSGGVTPEVPFNIPIDALHPGRFQPRRTFHAEDLDDLAQSIREKGVVQPILVRPLPEDPREYEIVAGERRWRAARMARRQVIPALIRHLSDQDAAEVALVENLQRRDLSPLEEAEGYARLQNEFSHTPDALATAVGKSRSHVVNMLRLLKLPESLKKHVSSGVLSAGHARALLNAQEPEHLAQQVIERGLSVRQTERLVTREGGVSARREPRAASHHTGTKGGTKGGGTKGSSVSDGRSSRDGLVKDDSDARALERDLSRVLGLTVQIDFEGMSNAGAVTIRYETLSQLDDILYRLNKPTDNSADQRRKQTSPPPMSSSPVSSSPVSSNPVSSGTMPEVEDDTPAEPSTPPYVPLSSGASFSTGSKSRETLATLLGTPESHDEAAPSLWSRAAASTRDHDAQDDSVKDEGARAPQSGAGVPGRVEEEPVEG